MSLRLLRVLLLTFAVSQAASAGKFQIPGGASEYLVAGYIRTETDQPIAGARVEFLSASHSVAHPSILANNAGEFSFGHFSPGNYEIVVELEGFQPARFPVEVTRFDQANLVIRLHKQPSFTSPGGDAITARQLAIPQKARSSFEKGVAKADSKAEYKGAIEDFRRAIKDYPDYYEAYSEMGISYVRLKDFSAAEKALRQSIELSARKYPPPLILLCMLLNDQGRAADAEPIARQVLAADPSAWRGPYELARAQLALRRLPEAQTSAYAARDLKPDTPDVYLLLSEIHRHTQDPAALMQDIDGYLKLAPTGPAAPQIRKLREQLTAYMKSQAAASKP
jgi:tetratricopeptide (TPR) repeat protein